MIIFLSKACPATRVVVYLMMGIRESNQPVELDERKEERNAVACKVGGDESRNIDMSL